MIELRTASLATVFGEPLATHHSSLPAPRILHSPFSILHFPFGTRGYLLIKYSTKGQRALELKEQNRK